MKKSRYTEEQIIAILKDAEAGVKVQDLCRQHDISDVTFYKWRSKYGGMEVLEARRPRALEDENRRLKSLVADLTLDNQALKRVVSKSGNARGPTRGRGPPPEQQLGLSERRSGRVLGVGRSRLQYVPRARIAMPRAAGAPEGAGCEARRRFGSPRLHVLLKREGWAVNHTSAWNAFTGRKACRSGANAGTRAEAPSACGAAGTEPPQRTLEHGLRHRQSRERGRRFRARARSPSWTITAVRVSRSRRTSR